MLQKIGVLSIMVAVLLSIAACDTRPKIETRDQAIAYIKDYLRDKSYKGENCLKLVNEENPRGYWSADYHISQYMPPGWTVTSSRDVYPDNTWKIHVGEKGTENGEVLSNARC